MNEKQPESEEARPVALANAPSQAVADQCQTVKTRKRNYRCVLTWFAGRWRNHQPKRAEKPHSKANAARRWPALLRGRRLRLPWRIASGSRQPMRRLMPALGKRAWRTPIPDLSLLDRKVGQGLFVSEMVFVRSGVSAERRMFERAAFSRKPLGESRLELS